MYLEHWKMKLKPFENIPDPRFFFASPQHDEGLMRLVYSIEEKKGASLLTGGFGCGKTLLVNTLMNKVLRGRFKFAMVSNPLLSPKEMLGEILRKLDHHTPGDTDKVDLHMKLEEVLLNNMRDGRNTVIIIDEAHVIESAQVLEEIRMLLNYYDSGQFLLTLLLVGQPELMEKIRRNPAMSQRIAVKYELSPFTKKQTTEYITHRLSVADAPPTVFTTEAIDLIHDYSGGIPRKINHVCDMSLFIGYTRNEEVVTPKIAGEAAAEMGG
ncbi:MAG TPA: AAA family ATPase [bacterium]|nr:AAA family ATPase [bacterium]